MKISCADTKDKDDSGVYRTSDLYLSAFLLSKRIPLVGAEKAGGQTLFVFREDSRIAQLTQEYLSNAPIPALSFKGALRELKALIYRGG